MFELSQTQIILGGFIITMIFNAGISWATMRQLRKDMNGFHKWADDHERWANKEVKDVSDRVSRLEGHKL